MLVWQPESSTRGLPWTTKQPTKAHRCRFQTGPERAICGQPAVAWLNRSRGERPIWWAYCEDHMYGRRISNGQVWHCVAMTLVDPASTVAS
jgi:hypothetical protein